jgi:hypothetical protein
MNSDLQFLPTADKERFQLQFTAKLDERERRLLAPCGSIQMDFSCIPVNFEMFTRDGKPCPKHKLEFELEVLDDSFMDFGKTWLYPVFNASDLRRAYVMGRNIQVAIENIIIVNLPLAPMVGFTKSWDVRFELPKGLANFEAYRRSILVRGQL